MASTDYTAKVHKDGPDTQVLESGAILDVKDGAVIKANTYPMPASVTFAFAAGAANASGCTISVLDGAGVAVTTPQNIIVLLSDAATGLAVTTHADVTIAPTTGSVLDVLVANKCHLVQTSATGVCVDVITDAHKTTFYVAAYLPSIGRTFVSRIMATADYT
jgi:hypothetical protein